MGGFHEPSAIQFETAAPTKLYPGIQENQTFEDIWKSSPFTNTNPLLFWPVRGSEHVTTGSQEICPEIQFHSPFEVHCTSLPPLVWMKPFLHATLTFVSKRGSRGSVPLTNIDPGGRFIGSRQCLLSQNSMLSGSQSPLGRHVRKLISVSFSWNPSSQVMLTTESAIPMVKDAIPWAGLAFSGRQFFAEIREKNCYVANRTDHCVLYTSCTKIFFIFLFMENRSQAWKSTSVATALEIVKSL